VTAASSGTGAGPGLSPREAARALLGAEPDRLRLVSRSVNDHWRVTAGTGRWVLRRYGTTQDDQSADWEERLVQGLGALGWPVAVPQAAHVDERGRRWALLPVLPGRTMPRQVRRWHGERGRLLAEMHRDLSALGRDQRPGWRAHVDGLRAAADDPAALVHAVKRALPCAGAIPGEVAALAERTAEVLNALDLDGGETQVVHGDFMPWNLLVTDRAVTGVLDFEKAHVDLRAADLAIATWGGRYAEAVLDGYESVAVLSGPERASLEPLWRATCLATLAASVRSSPLSDRRSDAVRWAVTHVLRPWGS
jgi:Ser/Thr protein kinase RdoA (MazF antagonist)